MPFLLYPLVAGSAGFAIGLFSGNAMSKVFQFFMCALVVAALAHYMGVFK